MIYGITGLKKAGKDTVARRMALRHDYVRLSYADPLYDMASAGLGLVACERVGQPGIAIAQPTGLPRRMIEDKEGMVDFLEVSFRDLMQKLGTEWGREMIHKDIWLRCMEQRLALIPTTTDVAIPDVRFDNEAKHIKSMGGCIIEVIRPIADDCKDAHRSEAGVSRHYIDYQIFNTAGIDELNIQVDRLVTRGAQ